MILESKNIRLRLVEETDAEFILKLRLDDRYNQFLSSVTPDLQSQKNWIAQYKIDEKNKSQFYFIIERLDGTPCGTLRVYDFKKDSFTLGSWILNEDKTKYAVVESAVLASKLGFEVLGFEKCILDVMKANKKVISFHKKIGGKIIDEDEKNYYFQFDKSDFYALQENLARMLK